ncbi:hypothetical protein LCGC14_1330500 [marine sediment metagenome]|uniref:Uncharacterized protein n=1 Tax=marine sediment metagenome TaxID=412755 RepID=A0A0F9KGT3_9ZZZZ
MDMQKLLSGLCNLLEDRAMGDFVTDNYEVVVGAVSVRNGALYITATADGTVKHFRLTEV